MICTQCGTQNPDNGTFCVGCGQSLQAAQAPQQYAQPQQQYAPPPQYAAAPAAPVGDEAKDAQDNKLMGVLAYIIFFIPLITGDYKKSPFVKFHTNQGIVLAIAGVAAGVVMGVLAFIPFLGWVLAPLVGLALTVFWILGIVNAVKGEKKELPLIGKITILK